MYSRLYRTLRLFYPGGWETRKHLNSLRKTQWLSRSELDQYQFSKIKHLVTSAYENIPYYHHLYQDHDIHPLEVKTWDDFHSLPIVTKEDVKKHLEEFINPRKQTYAQDVFTGASTGEPMKFYIEDSFWWWNAAYEQRGREWHGVQEGDKVAWIWGAEDDIPDWTWYAQIKSRLMRHRYLNAFNMTEKNMKQFADMLQTWQPALIRAYSSMLYLFARFLKENHIDDLRPTFVETTAEKLKPHQKKLVSDVFHCPVVDVYTAREFGTIGYTCEAGNLHIGETRYLELISNDHLPSGEQAGTVVITSLHQNLMPFIRYQLDDEACFSTEKCPCGRELPILKEIFGRTNDYILTPDDRFVHDGFFNFYFWTKPGVVQYQIYQPRVDHLQVRLVVGEEIDQGSLDTMRDELREELGKSMSIDIQVLDELELTPAGKNRYLISDVVEVDRS